METDVGPALDWLADKLFVLTVFIALSTLGIVAGWIVIVFVAREIIVTQFRYYCLSKGIKEKSSILGKLKLGVSMFAIVVLILGLDRLSSLCI